MIYFWLHLPYILKQQFPDPDAAAPRELPALTSLFTSSLPELSAVSSDRAPPRADALQRNLVTGGKGH